MPAGQVIGRVSVRVLPDTDRFARTAQDELDRIEKRLSVRVEAKLDISGLSRQLAAEVSKINQRNRQADHRKIRFHTMIATSSMNEAIRKAVRQLNDRAKNNKIQLDAELVAGNAKLVLDPNSLDEVKRQIDDWREKHDPVKLTVTLNMPAGAGAAITARIAALTRPRTVQIIPRINNVALAKAAASLAALSGARVLTNIFRSLNRQLSNLDRNVPIIGTLATAIAGLGAWSLTAGSNLAALSASLAQIGPLALLLPGLLGGLVVGLGATVAVFRDFDDVIPGVDDALSRIQDRMSANFWAIAREPIKELVDDLLPRFGAGLEQTSTQLGGFFAAFAAGLQGELAPIMAQMFSDLSESIAIATASTGDLAAIIAVLGAVGTSHLPGLADWFTRVTGRFADFLTTAAEDGSLQDWIDQGLTALRDLGRVLLNLGGIFAGVARAAEAAGGSSLGMLADTLERVHRVVDSEAFQTGLTDVLAAAHEAMRRIADISGPAVRELFIQLGELAETILPQAGTIIGTAFEAIASALAQPEVSRAVRDLFDGLQAAVEGLAPAMAPLARGLAGLVSLVGALAAVVGPLVATALAPLADAVAELAPLITPIATLLGETLTQAIGGSLAPAVRRLTPLVGTVLTSALAGLNAVLPTAAELFEEIVRQVTPLAEELLSGLAPILPVVGRSLAALVTAATPLVALFFEILNAILIPLIPVVEDLAVELLPSFTDSAVGLGAALQPVLVALLGLVNILMPVLAPALEFLAWLIGGSLVASTNGFVQSFTGMTDLVAGVWDVFAGAFTGDWEQFWNGCKNILTGILDTIIGGVEGFLHVDLTGILEDGLGLVKDIWQFGWDAVEYVATDTWGAIEGLFRGFMSTLTGIPGGGLSTIKRLFSEAWNSVKADAREAWDSLVDTVSDGIDDAVDFIGSLDDMALDALSGIDDQFVSVGSDIVAGIIRGVREGGGALLDELRGLASSALDAAKDFLGIGSPSKEFARQVGRWIPAGVEVGIASGERSLNRRIRQMVEVPSAPELGINAPSATPSAAVDQAAGTGGVTRVFNYYAAPGGGLSSEEDLFAAVQRARFGGW
jgi:phage-related protein